MKKLLMMSLAIFGGVSLLAEPFTWSNPLTLSAGTDNASNPRVGIDANGNAVAAWIQNGVVEARYHPVAGPWGSSAILSGTGATELALVVDPSGNATALWIENAVVKTATQPFLGSWGTATTLSTIGATSPRLSVDPNGDLVGIWERGGVIETATKPFHGQWPSLPEVLARGADSPAIAIGADNRTIVAVWHQQIHGVDTIFAAQKLIGGKWDHAKMIAQNSVNPDVAVDSHGNAAAVWYQVQSAGSLNESVMVQAVTKPFGKDWTDPVAISQPGLADPANLVAKVAYDGEGHAIALWNTSFDDASFAVQAATLANGTWSQPKEIVQSNVYAYDLDVAADARGDTFAIYMLSAGSSVVQIQAVEANIAATEIPWEAPNTLSQASITGFPRIAMTLTGNKINAVAVWLAKNSSSHQVLQSVAGVATIVQPPKNLTVVQHANNLNLFTEYYNTLSWQRPSVSGNVAGYLIYRNGVLIDQVAATVFSVQDQNRQPGEMGTYSVAAIDSAGFPSDTVSIAFP